MGGDRQPVSASSTESYALSAHHRTVLACLRARGGRATVVQLAREVAASRQDRSPAAVSPAATRRAYRNLVRYELDDLTRQGLVEVCEQTGTVQLHG
jgi:hypothetical protein